jgi:hypothetical protein
MKTSDPMTNPGVNATRSAAHVIATTGTMAVAISPHCQRPGTDPARHHREGFGLRHITTRLRPPTPWGHEGMGGRAQDRRGGL